MFDCFSNSQTSVRGDVAFKQRTRFLDTQFLLVQSWVPNSKNWLRHAHLKIVFSQHTPVAAHCFLWTTNSSVAFPRLFFFLTSFFLFDFIVLMTLGSLTFPGRGTCISTTPTMWSLNLWNGAPCEGLVMKSPVTLPAGHHTTDTSPLSILSVLKKC